MKVESQGKRYFVVGREKEQRLSQGPQVPAARPSDKL
jgi:hypothetical protein